MPFKKIGPNEYVSDKGTKFTKKQVALYYATDGFKNMRKETYKSKTGEEEVYLVSLKTLIILCVLECFLFWVIEHQLIIIPLYLTHQV